jgi:hypothetical protein
MHGSHRVRGTGMRRFALALGVLTLVGLIAGGDVRVRWVEHR